MDTIGKLKPCQYFWTAFFSIYIVFKRYQSQVKQVDDNCILALPDQNNLVNEITNFQLFLNDRCEIFSLGCLSPVTSIMMMFLKSTMLVHVLYMKLYLMCGTLVQSRV